MRISDWSSDVCSSDLRAAQHGVAHLLKGGFCQQSAGQVVVGLLIREDGPQAVAVTDFPKRRRAARVMSGVLSITSLMTRAAPERQPSASCRSTTAAKPPSTTFRVDRKSVLAGQSVAVRVAVCGG